MTPTLSKSVNRRMTLQKAPVKKNTFSLGDYVTFKKGKKVILGVVISTAVERIWFDKDEYLISTLDEDGDTRNYTQRARTLTKVKAPQYVVAWSDKYSDPVCQFTNLKDAQAFLTKKKRDGDVVETRLYKLVS